MRSNQRRKCFARGLGLSFALGLSLAFFGVKTADASCVLQYAKLGGNRVLAWQKNYWREVWASRRTGFSRLLIAPNRETETFDWWFGWNSLYTTDLTNSALRAIGSPRRLRYRMSNPTTMAATVGAVAWVQARQENSQRESAEASQNFELAGAYLRDLNRLGLVSLREQQQLRADHQREVRLWREGLGSLMRIESMRTAGILANAAEATAFQALARDVFSLAVSEFERVKGQTGAPRFADLLSELLFAKLSESQGFSGKPTLDRYLLSLIFLPIVRLDRGETDQALFLALRAGSWQGRSLRSVSENAPELAPAVLAWSIFSRPSEESARARRDRGARFLPTEKLYIFERAELPQVSGEFIFRDRSGQRIFRSELDYLEFMMIDPRASSTRAAWLAGEIAEAQAISELREMLTEYASLYRAQALAGEALPSPALACAYFQQSPMFAAAREMIDVESTTRAWRPEESGHCRYGVAIHYWEFYRMEAGLNAEAREALERVIGERLTRYISSCRNLAGVDPEMACPGR